MAKLVMRTHVVPTAASAKGRARSASATAARPTHRAAGCRFRPAISSSIYALSPTRSPSRPEGRSTSTAIRTMKANTSW